MTLSTRQTPSPEPQVAPIKLVQIAILPKGENPNQKAWVYKQPESIPSPLTILGNRELSYNNLLDVNDGLGLMLDLKEAFGPASPSVIVKHNNPCGAAVRDDPLSAFDAAHSCDKDSAFGGVIFSTEGVTLEFAKFIQARLNFYEVIVANSFSRDAVKFLLSKKNPPAIAICDYEQAAFIRRNTKANFRSLENLGEILVQEPNLGVTLPSNSPVVSSRKPSVETLRDLDFASIVAKHVKSNALVVAKGLKAIGIGAGQMSRVDSTRFAIEKAENHNHSLDGAVAAHDAFIPFPDSANLLLKNGIIAIAEPGGSVKDQEVIATVNDHNACLIFTGMRTFKH